MGGTATYSGYYQEPASAFSNAMSQHTMPYQSGYGQDSRQTHNFGAYNPSMMYNVAQPGAQSSVYDTSQQFPPRQAAGLQMIPTDVAAPYFPSEPTNTATAPSLQSQGASSGTSAVYQQSQTDQRAMLQNYPSGIASMGGMAETNEPDQDMEEQEPAAGMGEAYGQFQSALKEIFTNIRAGALQPARESLLNVSDWLLTKVVDLDDVQRYDDRMKLWHDFNNAWLSIFQKQKDLMGSGFAVQRGQSLILAGELEEMGKKLVGLCDGIERHGLVDYQYGVWEELIVEILMECMDLYESANQAGSSNANAAGPSHHTPR
ncbi:hypothetical protein DL770_007270 [Monosporascus sp. CRB-9-2]|nr:hypothetical protein DL770_007270 [Monosporascus sp. CRB-9-2]